ncbi:MAG: hypothetical protein HYW49_04680 [Deltaproteobacteria bacterium]|nr:hypothetical protein [Deltaproteobacteria bacterium]
MNHAKIGTTPKRSLLTKKFLYAFMAVIGISTIFAIRMARTNYSSPDNDVLATVIQSTGKHILGGRFLDSRIQRRNADGTVDETFSRSWSAGGFNNTVMALAVQADDQILAAGEFTNFDSSLVGHIARLKADGSLDTAFANAIGTGFDDTVSSVAVQSDGKILVGGAFSSFNGTSVARVARLNADGTLDSTFTPNSGFDAAVRSIHIDSSGRILVGGDFKTYSGTSKPYLASLLSNGGLDAEYPKK